MMFLILRVLAPLVFLWAEASVAKRTDIPKREVSKVLNQFGQGNTSSGRFVFERHLSSCGDGNVGDGVCADAKLCCSQYGYCGTTDEHCSNPQPCGNGKLGTGVCSDKRLCCSKYGWCGTTPQHCDNRVDGGLIGGVVARNHSRMVAFVPNWIACPSSVQLSQYTHVVIAFATSIVIDNWPNKNVCSQNCDIETPVVCGNVANSSKLISNIQKAGKKVLVSFGGASMGGSWEGDVNDCWEYCFGKEDHVVNQLVQIVKVLNADGVDLDYEYFYEDDQYGSNFTKGAQAQKFIAEVTLGLRNNLPAGALVTHAPMDTDLVPGRGYFQVLQNVSSSLSFLMPQYYNGIVRPVADGFNGTGEGSMSASMHYSTLVNTLFGGDPTRVVFGFCLKECGRSNADSSAAKTIARALAQNYGCNGGAFFWSSEYDKSGSWSSEVNKVVQKSNTSCGDDPPPQCLNKTSTCSTTTGSTPCCSPLVCRRKSSINPLKCLPCVASGRVCHTRKDCCSRKCVNKRCSV